MLTLAIALFAYAISETIGGSGKKNLQRNLYQEMLYDYALEK
jgi:hypothetical protein